MDLNVLEIRFGGVKDTVSEKPLTQWDKGQILKFVDEKFGDNTEVQFSSGYMTETINKSVKNNQVMVPDQILKENYIVFAWVKEIKENSETTTREVRIPVKPRTKPSDYLEPDEEKTFRQEIEDLVDSSIETSEEAKKQAEEAKNTAEESLNKAEEVERRANEGEFDGKEGDTPVKGVDYWTTEDKKEMKDFVMGDVEALLQKHTDEVRPHPNEINSYTMSIDPNVGGLIGKKGDICFETVDSNLIVNPKFENGLNGWIVLKDSVLVREDKGLTYAECNDSAGWSGVLRHSFQITKSGIYTFSFKCKGEMWFHIYTSSYKELHGNDRVISNDVWGKSTFTIEVSEQDVGLCYLEIYEGSWKLTDFMFKSVDTPPTRLWRYENEWVALGYISNDPNPQWNSITNKPDLADKEYVDNASKPTEYKATYNSAVSLSNYGCSFTRVGNFVNAILNIGVNNRNAYFVQFGTLPEKVLPKDTSVAVNGVTNEGKPCYFYFDKKEQGGAFGLRLQNMSDTIGTDGIRANVTYLIKE